MKSELVKDAKYPEMWRVKWPDGEVSDMVNKTRAKDAIRRYEEYSLRHDLEGSAKGPRSLADAFK